MDFPFKELVTIYGPLGLGWPIALWLLIRLLKVMELHRNDVLKIVDTINQLRTAMTVLAERMK